MRIGDKLSLSPPLLVSLSLLVIVLVLAPNTAHGQYATCPDGLCPVNRTPSGPPPSALSSPLSAASCRVTVGDGSAGSGTLIARNATTGLVLTCSHLFDESTANVVVAFANGRRYGARIVDRDRTNDLAALLIRRPDDEPVEVSADDEPMGLLSACGFGPDGRFRCVRGNVVGQATPIGATYPSVVVSGAVRPGDSGGGVLNTSGRLVGVVWGEQGGQTYLTCGRPLRRFLQRVLGEDNRTARQPPASPGDPAAGNASAGANPPVAAGDTLGRAKPGADGREWLARLSALGAQLNTLRSDVAALRESKQDKGAYLTPGALDDYARRDEVDGPLAAITGRFTSLRGRLDVLRQQVESVADSGSGFTQGLSIGKVVAGALGLSGPLAAAVVIAGGLVGRRIGKKLATQASGAQGGAPDNGFRR